MRRREFIILASGAVITALAERAWSLSARAQQSQRVRRIGVLMGLKADDPESQARLAAFAQGLQQAGWIVGQNIRIDYRWGAGNAETMNKHAAELVSHAPDVILAHSSAAVAPLRQASRTIPIVFTLVADPVGAGYVNSLAQPGGNVTGIRRSEYGASLAWPEMLKLIAPNVMRVAIIRDPDAATDHGQIAAIQDVAPAVGMEAFALDADSLRDLERAIAGFSRSPNGGLIVTISEPSSRDRSAIVRLAARFKLPAIYADRQFVTSGGLMSYGPDRKAEYRLAADYVDRILKGTKPGDLPIQLPTKFQLSVNLKTALALGIAISQSMLLRADEVIE